MPSWDQLDEFITKRLNMIESICDMKKRSTNNSNTTRVPTYNAYIDTSHKACKSGERTVLPTALLDLEHQGILFPIRAFIDQGSQESFISHRIVNRLQIPTRKSCTMISALGGTILENASTIFLLTLKSMKSDLKIRTNVIVISNLYHLMPATPTAVCDFSQLKSLKLADSNFFNPAPIDLLIGSDILPTILKPGLHKQICGNLMAQDTEFGCIVSGKPTLNCVASFASWATTIDPLNEDLKRFCELENVSNENSMSTTDIWCEEHYKRNVNRRSDGRYVVKLPFRQDLTHDQWLGASRRAAMGQFLNLEKNFELASEYKKLLSEYLLLDHMKQTSCLEIVENPHYRSFYLPHHAVVKPERTTTKWQRGFANQDRKIDESVQQNKE
ncbi:uncharacterized protein [Musca autumnalis]|uniref:uncharacterized protein n=1 Tax=Musca autumnalis TaxID=221902 RepID=UPI003CEF8ADB